MKQSVYFSRMKTQREKGLQELAENLDGLINKMENLLTKEEPKKNETFENYINFMHND